MSTPSACFESHSFFFFIECTFREAAEQTPRPRVGSAQAAGASHDHAHVAWRTPITDESWRLRVHGANGSRATSIRAGERSRSITYKRTTASVCD